MEGRGRSLFRVSNPERPIIRAGAWNGIWLMPLFFAGVAISESRGGWKMWIAIVITGLVVAAVAGMYRLYLARIDFDGGSIRIVRAVDSTDFCARPSTEVTLGRLAAWGLIWGRCRTHEGARRTVWFMFSELQPRVCAGENCLRALREALEAVGVRVKL